MEALWNTHRQGGIGDTELLQCAILSLCAEGEISRDEAVDVRLAVEGKCPVGFYGRQGGNIFTPEEVVDAFLKFNNLK